MPDFDITDVPHHIQVAVINEINQNNRPALNYADFGGDIL